MPVSTQIYAVERALCRGLRGEDRQRRGIAHSYLAANSAAAGGGLQEYA